MNSSAHLHRRRGGGPNVYLHISLPQPKTRVPSGGSKPKRVHPTTDVSGKRHKTLREWFDASTKKILFLGSPILHISTKVWNLHSGGQGMGPGRHQSGPQGPRRMGRHVDGHPSGTRLWKKSRDEIICVFGSPHLFSLSFPAPLIPAPRNVGPTVAFAQLIERSPPICTHPRNSP